MRTETRRPPLGVERLESRTVPSTFVVAPDGDDAAAGTDSAPWRTLQHAADVVQPGDTVAVRAGHYAGFHLTSSGTAEAAIAFEADPGVVIDARNPVTPDGINLEGASHVTIRGFQVVGMPRAGIRSVLNSHVTIRDNVADQNGVWGIFSGFSEDLLIEGNTATRSAIEHGIYVSNSADRPVVRGNVIWGNRGNGLHMNGDVHAGGDGIISGATVEGNTIYDNGVSGGSAINCDGVQGAVIRNNLLFDNHASGISLYRIDGGGGSSGNLVINNTVLVAADGRWALNLQQGATDNTVRNNILYNRGPYRGSLDASADSLPGLESDYNVVMDRFTVDGGDTRLTLSEWQSATGQDAHSLVATPDALFVDPAGDYHLAATSPAIDAGTSLGAPATDLDGAPRPSGAGHDIGAFEASFIPDNDPPTAADRSFVTDEDATLEITSPGLLSGADDPDGDSLTAALVDPPVHGTVDVRPDGAFTYTPAPNFHGEDSFTYATHDGTVPGAPAIVRITIASVPDAPELPPIVDRAANEEARLSFPITATDADGPTDPLTYTLDPGAPAGAQIDADTGLFSWTPTEADGAGSFDVTVRVTDSSTLSAVRTFTISVAEVNRAPALAPIADVTAAEETLVTFTAQATDPDLPANALRFRLVGAPEGAAIDEATGVFTWTPTAAQGPGAYRFIVRVEDGSLSDERSVSVMVNEPVEPPPPPGSVEAESDYDGDGRADLALYHFDDVVGIGRFEILESLSGQTRTFELGGPVDVPISGDFDGDGITDIAIVQPEFDLDGGGTADATRWVMILSSTGERREILFGAPGRLDRPAPADFDGDGITDIATFRANSDLVPGAAQWFVLPSGGGPAFSVVFGAAGGTDLPAVADWDGDGKADIATFRPVSDLVPGAAQWFILPSGPNPGYRTTVGALPVTFGAAGNADQPAMADWDGDRRADVTAFRSVSDLVAGAAQWFTLPSAPNQPNYARTDGGYPTTFGAAGEIAAVGDYDADGRPDLAVFAPPSGSWRIRRSRGGPDQTISFGPSLPNMVPVASPLFFRLRATGNPTSAAWDTNAQALRLNDRAIEELGDASGAR